MCHKSDQLQLLVYHNLFKNDMILVINRKISFGKQLSKLLMIQATLVSIIIQHKTSVDTSLEQLVTTVKTNLSQKETHNLKHILQQIPGQPGMISLLQYYKQDYSPARMYLKNQQQTHSILFREIK